MIRRGTPILGAARSRRNDVVGRVVVAAPAPCGDTVPGGTPAAVPPALREHVPPSPPAVPPSQQPNDVVVPRVVDDGGRPCRRRPHLPGAAVRGGDSSSPSQFDDDYDGARLQLHLRLLHYVPSPSSFLFPAPPPPGSSVPTSPSPPTILKPDGEQSVNFLLIDFGFLPPHEQGVLITLVFGPFSEVGNGNGNTTVAVLFLESFKSLKRRTDE
eukprot:CAMPEP_0201607540 /NCGR_PEP_ID=MMETSP0492-20130828/6612_1 /ASSEMBLY_ACC=CAM_ASM_000837 /TAXON_ID=420259 /ORGANISM="Thalassiosira gravida, Strain GMp14c1" /LENGTH=212 /DNA_ID=CAMNT_0048072145 /DNA_START=429 /DNA_END=1067 /DNA_ORIENTATION=-